MKVDKLTSSLSFVEVLLQASELARKNHKNFIYLAETSNLTMTLEPTLELDSNRRYLNFRGLQENITEQPNGWSR